MTAVILEASSVGAADWPVDERKNPEFVRGLTLSYVQLSLK